MSKVTTHCRSSEIVNVIKLSNESKEYESMQRCFFRIRLTLKTEQCRNSVFSSLFL